MLTPDRRGFVGWLLGAIAPLIGVKVTAAAPKTLTLLTRDEEHEFIRLSRKVFEGIPEDATGADLVDYILRIQDRAERAQKAT